jgi:predicted TIM-barrel fold metal-dependent hydrolase
LTAFIDFHVHPPVAEFTDGPLQPFRVDLDVMSIADVADHYRARDGRAVLLGLDTESTTRLPPFSTTDVALMVEAAPDVLFGLGSVDPARGAKAVAGIHEASRFGLAGIALDPVVQGFDPAERSIQHLWDIAADHGLIVLFHTGETRLGRGQPGGGGLRLANGDPRLVDAVAARHPGMRIVLAHSGSLWREEALAVAGHKGNVWLTMVGEPAGNVATLLEAQEGMVHPGGCLFGSGWAFGDLDAQLKEWDAVDEELRRVVLHDNAAALLGLDEEPEEGGRP